MRHEGRVENRAVYVAIGVDLDGRKDVLGLWTSSNEGAKFWLGVLTELKNRGVKDVLIACMDGLKGFPQAIESVFPETRIQLCIVHLVRASLELCELEGAQAGGGRSEIDLPGVDRSASLVGIERFYKANGDTSTRQSESCGRRIGSGSYR